MIFGVKFFFSEKQGDQYKGMTYLENHHFATPSEIMDEDNNNQMLVTKSGAGQDGSNRYIQSIPASNTEHTFFPSAHGP